MAEAVVSFALERIGDLLTEEARFLYGVSDKVEQLQNELNRMRAFLKDADARQYESESIRNWILEIREVSCDAEDVVDTYALKLASEKKRGSRNFLKNFARSLHKAKVVHKIGSEIETISAKIESLRTSLQTYGIKDLGKEERSSSSSNANERRAQLRRTFSHVVEPTVVGLDKDEEILVKQLVREDCGPHLISICGMGGLGKTTLARKVYYSDAVRKHFDCFVWECISQQCKARDVWEGILIQLTSPSQEEREIIRKLRDTELAKKLCQVQREKKCLLVLDDIWSIQDWTKLSAALQIHNSSSKIIITTRNREIAPQTNLRSFLHRQHHLTDYESWELLCSTITSRQPEKECAINAGTEKLGRGMIKHCSGLPLAIKALGGVLASEHTTNGWGKVYKNINLHIRQGKDVHQAMNVSEVLALSYDDLPYYLKPCFLYLSQFPENYKIRVEKLICMWMAEGILLPLHDERPREESLEDFGGRCIEELVQRGLVQAGKRDFSGRIKTCHLHDLMRDLCLQKAREERFSEVLDRRSGNEVVPCTSIAQARKIRRVVIWSGGSAPSFLPLQTETHQHLRSIMYINSEQRLNAEQRTEYCTVVITALESFKLLRVLDLEGFGKGSLAPDVKLPVHIGNLIHLKFFSIRNTNVTELPPTIEKLSRLLTLDLRSDGTLEIPNVIWKLRNLRNLYFPKNCSSRSNEIQLPSKKLRKVKYLPAISVNDESWNSLSELAVHRQDSYEAMAETFRLPCRSLQNLTTLTLTDTKINRDPLKELEKLPSLGILKLCRDACTGVRMHCSSEGFPQLRTLSLGHLKNFRYWSIDEGAMPNLCQLKITNCSRLRKVPEGLKFLKALQRICITTDPEDVWFFKRRLSNGGEDFSKVQHVRFRDVRAASHRYSKMLKRDIFCFQG